ncbi:MAG: CHAT domain-containing tetratricopeptide repeat protein [Alphaproteobacteria bacterium]
MTRLAALVLWLCVVATPAAAGAIADAYKRYKSLLDAGRYVEAEAPALEAIALARQQRGAEHRDTAILMNNLGLLYRRMGRLADAETQLTGAMAIRRRTLGDSHGDVAQSANNVGLLYLDLGRYGEAEPLLQEALAIRTRLYGSDDPRLASTLQNLGLLHWRLARFGEAETTLRRAVELRRRDGNDFRLGATLNDLGLLLVDVGRMNEARAVYNEALAAKRRAGGDSHPSLASTLTNIGRLERTAGNFDAADAALRRSLDLKQSTGDDDRPTVATTLLEIGRLASERGDYGEAEDRIRQAVAIRERELGAGNAQTGEALADLGLMFRQQGRFEAAEPLYRQALAVQETALGPDHLQVAIALNNLGELLRLTDRAPEAVEPLQRAAAIMRRTFAHPTPRLAEVLENLGAALTDTGALDDADSALAQTLDIREAQLGPDHPEIAMTLLPYGRLALRQQQPAAAADRYRRAATIFAAALGEAHPSTAKALFGLARAQAAAGDRAGALNTARRGLKATRTRLARASDKRDSGWTAEQRTRREDLLFLSELLVGRSDAGLDELTQTLQLAGLSRAARALARMAARFATGTDALAETVRQRQDLVQRLTVADETLLLLSARPGGAGGEAAALRNEVADLRGRIDALDQRLAQDFPRYAQLTNPPPLSLADARALLKPGEAMLVLSTGERATVGLAIGTRSAAGYVAPIGARDLADAVYELRAGVDLGGIASLNDLPRFDTRLAADLYRDLLQPAENVLKDVRHLFVISDGPLANLPLGVLVTEPQATPPFDFKDYLAVPWLAKRYAVSVLPSLGALRALRVFAARTAASSPFLGYGEPQLEGVPGQSRAALRNIVRAGSVSVRDLRQLSPLPDTAREIQALAQTLGAPADAVRLGPKATESDLRGQALDRYRVLTFATHGLLPDDLSGLSESALVLSPPTAPRPGDDGLLTASEISALTLNADWVVLSACNTGAAPTTGGGGVASLAEAFFYAGARTLLVSHWSVESKSTVALTTGLFKQLAEGRLGKAEAFAQAMERLRTDKTQPAYAHPAFWAPFVVVGDGG